MAIASFYHTEPSGPEVSSTLRWTKDIGCFTLDRSRERSCVHRTAYCDAHRYNVKLEKAFHTISPKDAKNDTAWSRLTPSAAKRLAETLGRKRNQTSRVRLMSRGEAFATLADVDRVESLLQACPDTAFWIPTRAWRDATLRTAIETRIRPYANAYLLAPMDPTNTPEEWQALRASGWSTMFFGNDDPKWNPPTEGYTVVRCPKTWRHIHGLCGGTCKAGCFSSRRRQVCVHLKSH